MFEPQSGQTWNISFVLEEKMHMKKFNQQRQLICHLYNMQWLTSCHYHVRFLFVTFGVQRTVFCIPL